MKVIRTAVGDAEYPANLLPGEIGIRKDALLLYCADGSVLKVSIQTCEEHTFCITMKWPARISIIEGKFRLKFIDRHCQTCLFSAAPKCCHISQIRDQVGLYLLLR